MTLGKLLALGAGVVVGVWLATAYPAQAHLLYVHATSTAREIARRFVG
jgi:hypothetical protein